MAIPNVKRFRPFCDTCSCSTSPKSRTRPRAALWAAFTITLIVAYLTDGIDLVRHIFSDPDKFVTAEPFLFLFASLIVLIFGPGAISIDHFLGKKFGPSASSGSPPPA